MALPFLTFTRPREAFLCLLVLFGAAVVVLTEVLGFCHLLAPLPLALAWAALLAVAASSIRLRFTRPRRVDWWIVTACVAIAAIAATTAFTAWLSPPNSADAMAYHLPRVVYWAQNHSVAVFPTPYYNQVMLPPAAEYVMLHTYLLSGGDHLVNFVSWLGFLGSIVGVSLLGGALAAVVNTRVYQARQGRAFSEMERSAAASASVPTSSTVNALFPLTLDADPLVLGRIEIPRIGVSAIVREGDDDKTLGVAVGHIPGTARPGERGNMALAGHRDSFFSSLRHIQLHDTIRIRTASRHYEYFVDSIELVAPEETRVLDPTSDEVLTLVTCYPFEWVGHAPKRFIVRARVALLRAAPR